MVVAGSYFVDALLNCFDKNTHGPKPPKGSFTAFLNFVFFNEGFLKGISVRKHRNFSVFLCGTFRTPSRIHSSISSRSSFIVLSFYRFATRTLTFFVANYFVFNFYALHDPKTEYQTNSFRIRAHILLYIHFISYVRTEVKQSNISGTS